MTATSSAAPWIERMARIGYVAKAILYGTIGLLAGGAAFGRGDATDTRGAMTRMVEAPFGRALLGVIAAGLLGYSVWRMVSAVVDAEERGRDLKGFALRSSFFLRGLAHLALAYSATKLAAGRSDAGGDTSERATEAAFQLPGGTLIVWIVAVGIAGFGSYQLYRAVRAKLSKQLDISAMAAETSHWVIGVSRFGIAARGLVFIAIGWLLSRAAAEHDSHKAGGIADALASLAQLGRWPYAAIGVGLIAYGVYELLNARYRRIQAA